MTNEKAVDQMLPNRKRQLQKKKKKPSASANSSSTQVPSTKVRLESGWTRATFIIREEHLEKIKTLAFMGKIPIKDLVDRVFKSFFSSKKNQNLFSSKKDLFPQRQAELLEELFKE